MKRAPVSRPLFSGLGPALHDGNEGLVGDGGDAVQGQTQVNQANGVATQVRPLVRRKGDAAQFDGHLDLFLDLIDRQALDSLQERGDASGFASHASVGHCRPYEPERLDQPQVELRRRGADDGGECRERRQSPQSEANHCCDASHASISFLVGVTRNDRLIL